MNAGDIAVIRGNLRRLELEDALSAEKREAHLDDLLAPAAELIRQGLPPDDGQVTDLYDVLMPRGSAAAPEDTLADNLPAVESRLRLLTLTDRVRFARELSRLCAPPVSVLLCQRGLTGAGSPDDGDADEIDAGDDGDTDNAPPGRVSYLRNFYADAAYTAFSRVLPDPTVTYASDFTGVCEDVFYGRASCCILPLESTADGPLVRFRAMVRRYELKTVFTTVVSGSGGATRFALLRRAPEMPDVDPRLVAGHSLECDVSLPSADALTSLLTAAQLCGLTPERVDRLPSEEDTENAAWSLLFRTDGGDPDAFLCLLMLERVRFTLIGLRTELKPVRR